ncbi:MAG: DNA repair protein RadC [Burkholderiales bacterium]|nr:DNA repair protein RadC [Burkholderiales bacterium]
MLSMGPQALADVELLALLLRTGLQGLGVLQLAEKVLNDLGGVSGLLHAQGSQLSAIKGLGPAKRSELMAVMELARRALSRELSTQPVFNSPQTVKDYLRIKLGALPHEVFAVLFLDAQQRLITCEEMFRGSLTQTSVYPREVVKRALALNAACVVLAHNHPSGVLEPSRADELLTQTLKSSLALVDVRVLDHLVVGAGGALSFAERGLL